jgi:hypothetical protein
MTLQTEPARIISTITAAATALVALLVAFGVDMSEDQRTAILSAVAVAAPIVGGLVIRQNVYSPAAVEKVADRQYEAGKPPTEEPQPEVPPPPG